MRIVIAPDSFKETLSAPDVAQAMARGVRLAFPDAEVDCVPMADGGEGTVDVVLAATGGERRVATVRNALGEPVAAHWGWLDGGCAVVEMATAAGLEQIPEGRRDPMRACSAGVGELIRAALDAGASRLVLALGGSAVNDGGAGMMRALGARFLDEAGRELAPGGAALADLAHIDLSGLDARLAGMPVEVAVDVDNPLCGDAGASRVFGPQKGADPEQVRRLDAALARLADVSARVLGRDEREVPGTGAAGGLGFAARAFLGAGFRPGVALIAELVGLADRLRGAALVLTGEGRCDAQTVRGKTPAGVAALAREAGVPAVVLAGALGEGYQALYAIGVTAAFSLASGPMTLAQAYAGTARLLEARSCDVARLALAGR